MHLETVQNNYTINLKNRIWFDIWNLMGQLISYGANYYFFDEKNVKKIWGTLEENMYTFDLNSQKPFLFRVY